MNLTSITARYLRRKQPQQFEPAEAELIATFTAPEGSNISIEQASAFYDKALGDVQAMVMSKMSGKPATGAAPVVTGSVLKVEAPAQKTTTPVKPAETKPAPAAAAPAAEAPKNKGGRPRKDAVKPAEAKVEKDEFGDPIVPAKTEAAAAPADGTDEFGDPVSAAAATPDDDEFAENEVKPMSPTELQQIFTGLVMEKKVAGSDIKTIMLKYGAARTADTQEKDRAKILAEVKALIKK